MAWFRELISRVCAAFPDHQPYGGAFTAEDVTPHCTIAVGEGFPNGPSDRDLELFAQIEDELAATLPIGSEAMRLAVIADERGCWTTIAHFDLGP